MAQFSGPGALLSFGCVTGNGAPVLISPGHICQPLGGGEVLQSLLPEWTALLLMATSHVTILPYLGVHRGV